MDKAITAAREAGVNMNQKQILEVSKAVNWWLNQDRFGRPRYSIVLQKPNKFWLCWVKPDLTLEKNLGPTTTNALSLILLAYRHHLKNMK